MVDFNYYKEVKLMKLRSQLISTLSNKQRKDLCRVYKINNGYKKHSQCWNFVLNDNIKNKLKQDYNIVTDYIYEYNFKSKRG